MRTASLVVRTQIDQRIVIDQTQPNAIKPPITPEYVSGGVGIFVKIYEGIHFDAENREGQLVPIGSEWTTHAGECQSSRPFEIDRERLCEASFKKAIGCARVYF